MPRSRSTRRRQRAREREATSPADAPQKAQQKGWKATALRLWTKVGENHVGLIAAGVAFYGLLAIFPGIAASMAIAGLVTQPDQIVSQLEQAGEVLPPEASSIIIGQAEAVAGAQSGLGLAAALGLLIAIWSASKGMGSLMEGLNVVYGEDEKRGIVRVTVTRLLLTLTLIVGLLLGLAMTLVLPAVLGLLGLGQTLEWIVSLSRWPILFLLTLIGLGIVYRYGPSRRDAKWRWLTPGAAVATVLWVSGSVAFSFYVSNFASYNETFGALGGVIILLMWLWLSAYVVLFGAQFDHETAAPSRHDGQTRR